jgi:hypothetical protein
MRLFLFVVVLALAVLGALAAYPPPLPPGADGWHSCGVPGKAQCHTYGSWNQSGGEYLVMWKAVDNSMRTITRIASGVSARCSEDWFGGRLADDTPHDCYFTEVDGKYVVSPVSSKGWGARAYIQNEAVSLPAGLWAIKYQNKYDVRNYVVGLSGADFPVSHACRDYMVGMSYGTKLAHDGGAASPVSPNKMDGLCFVSVDPVIAATDMKYFDEFAFIGQSRAIPFTATASNGVIVRIGSQKTNNWQYKQIFSYKEGEPILCDHPVWRAMQEDYDEVCEYFNPPDDYELSFSNNVARWHFVDGLDGNPGDPLEQTFSVSVSSTRGTESSEEWGTSLTASVEVSVEYAGVGGSVGLSAEQSKSISETVHQEVTREGTDERKRTCYIQPGHSYAGLWVWRVTGDEEMAWQPSPRGTYAIQSSETACTSNKHAPCCPPGWETDPVTQVDCRDNPSFVVKDDCKKKMKAQPTLR